MSEVDLRCGVSIRTNRCVQIRCIGIKKLSMEYIGDELSTPVNLSFVRRLKTGSLRRFYASETSKSRRYGPSEETT